MRPEAYQLLADRQQTYWWHKARRAMALSLLRRNGLASACRWIDIGCGPGGNLHMLDSLQPREIVGVDLSAAALAFAGGSAPSARLVLANINDPLPFSDDSFDVATIFNVLYHQWVQSESAVLVHAGRILRPGGLLLFTEPAFDVLRREMDDAVMTRRRYEIAEFDEWLDAAGFESLYASYFTSFGVPLLLVARYAQKRRWFGNDMTAVDMRPLPEFINNVLLGVATFEGALIANGVKMPFGTTLVRLARRRP